MRTLGLLGGMSWESTLTYYRYVNERVREKLGGLHSAKLVLYSVDFAEIERLQHIGDWVTAGRVLADAAQALERAGAAALVLCTNTMHCVLDTIEPVMSREERCSFTSPIPERMCTRPVSRSSDSATFSMIAGPLSPATIVASRQLSTLSRMRRPTLASLLSFVVAVMRKTPVCVGVMHGAGETVPVSDSASLVFANVISASGAKYAAGQYIWWTKGEEATLYKDWKGGEPADGVSCKER